VRSLVIVVVAGSLSLAQSVVPVEKEPHHRVAFENTWVRVLDVSFPAGAASLFHRHALNNVAIRIVGGTTRADPVGGEGRPQLVPTGRVVFYTASPPYEHRVSNVGTAAVRILDIELLGAGTAVDTGANDDLARHVVEIENDHVRVSRIELGPGESLPAHSHRRGWLAVIVAGRKPGDFAWHAPGSRVSAGGAAERVDLVEIEPKDGPLHR
jgi:quercetin dioxygenase-like cupin family protein